MRDTPTKVNEQETQQQLGFIHSIAALKKIPKLFHIVTYGCQMNEHDSEKIKGMLLAMGLKETDNRMEADIIIYNTCCVRENAERRALGNVGWLRLLKKQRPELIIGIGGCMMQQPGMAEKLKKRYKFVELAFGTHNMYRLPELLHRVLTTRQATWEVLKTDGEIQEGLPISRTNSKSAYITIMYGCNNFCSYCIVPFVRGRERSRSSEDIVNEIILLKDSGVEEIMLLGQNVNSYGNDLPDGLSFPELLREIDKLGIPRVRFMTSHPKDLSDELILAIGDLKSICAHMHLPVQSGSNEVLNRMNRKYTVEHYMGLVEKLRVARPGIGITTDIIVGFPGETEEQFLETCDLVEKVGFDSAYTFMYSKRDGTSAADYEKQIDETTKKDRIHRLIAIQERASAKVFQSIIGSVQQVLVDGFSSRDDSQLTGKSSRWLTVNFTGDAKLIGSIVNVKITDVGRNTLKGTLLDNLEE